MNATTGLNYVARCPECGNVVGASTSDCFDLAKILAGWIKDKLSVERLTPEATRNATWCHADGCSMVKKKGRKR